MDTTKETALEEAVRMQGAARAQMDAARKGSRKWAEAADALDFWGGKVTMLKILG